MKQYELKLNINAQDIFYNETRPSWSWCSKPSKDNTVKQITFWTYCRETAAMNFKRSLNSKARNTVDSRRARVLCKIIIGSKKPMNEESAKRKKDGFLGKMERAVRVINILEKEHKWPLTELCDIRISYKKNNSQTENKHGQMLICMFTGSAKWLRSPHMVSLWLLLLRAGSDKILCKAGNYKELMERVKEFVKRRTTPDASYIHTTSKYWSLIMANHTALFRGFPLKRNYDNRRAWGGKGGSNEGIRKLCAGVSYDKKLQKRFEEVCHA